MLRATNRPILAYFDSIKNLRLRQLSLILKTGYDPNLMLNARGQNGLQYMINFFWTTDSHFRLQVPINKAAYLSIAKLLLDSGLDPNAADLLSGETAIYDAVRFNDKDMVALLLNYVDFSVRNKNGETIVMCAARFGSKQTMRMILEHLRSLEMDGYFLRQRNRFGLTPLELARAENLDCAKVLTKHLIAFGHHTGAVLARSSSHHQLRALPYHLRPTAAGYNPRAAAAAQVIGATAALDDSGLSDYSDCDVLTGAYHHHVATPMPRASISRAMTTGFKTGSGFYDPKAAEFNQYLLEQQDFAVNESLGQQQQQQQGGSGAAYGMSDDEDYFGAGIGTTGNGGGGLTRSRSCMLGPSTSGGGGAGNQAKQSKYSAGGKAPKGSQNDGNKMGSWDGNSGGGGGRGNQA